MEVAGCKICQRTWDGLREGLPDSGQGGSMGELKMRLRKTVGVMVAGGREKGGL